MGFGYFLKLTHEPKYNTLTWTMDYRYSSDLDDSVGHWQVMNHPSKRSVAKVKRLSILFQLTTLP